MDMREKIALAIEPGPWSIRGLGMPLDAYQQGLLSVSLSRADAVLEALRTPDEAMLKAARDAGIPLVHHDSISARWNMEFAARWKAAIDAARTKETV